MHCQCKKNSPMKDDDLFLSRQNYTGNQLRIDGYYYNEYGSGNETRREIYFFYRNGILLKGGVPLLTELSIRENEFKNGTYYNYVKDSKLDWGVFQINGNNIKYEHWYPNSIGPLRAVIHEGIILNDTTFLITQTYRMKDGNKTDVSFENLLYRFKKLSPKPDSTNQFIQ